MANSTMNYTLLSEKDCLKYNGTMEGTVARRNASVQQFCDCDYFRCLMKLTDNAKLTLTESEFMNDLK